MFNSLTDSLQSALKKLRGQAVISESNIAEAMSDIQEALLDADVNASVAEEFVSQVRTKCLGEDVLKSVTPGQMAVKIVYDNLVELMGADDASIVSGGKPSVIMMVGLHGSGKTTSSAKLAKNLKGKGKKVLLAAADVYRPAAIDQIEFLGREIGVDVYADRNSTDVPTIARKAYAEAVGRNMDYLIIDTAGRLQIDESMVQELVRVKAAVPVGEILLVADAALGQQAVSVAKHFNDALSLTGIVLTKLDGDSRGGAALSIRKITGCPVKFVGIGEKLDDLDVFHPDRMASRIMGMGDIVSLVEKAADNIDKEEAAKLEEKLKKSSFDFDDFLSQLRQMKKMGGVEALLKFLPGGDKIAGMSEFDTSKFTGMEAIISSMTKKERANPDVIDISRRRRIAKGSGRKQEEVSQLINQFTMMRKIMKNKGLLGRLLGGGGGGLFGGGAMPSMPSMGGMMGGMRGGFGGGFGRGGSNYTPPKKKRKK